MPSRKDKKAAQQTSHAAPAASIPTEGTLTPKQINAALAQLLERQRQTQQQMDILIAHQNRTQPTNCAVEKANGDRTRQHT